MRYRLLLGLIMLTTLLGACGETSPDVTQPVTAVPPTTLSVSVPPVMGSPVVGTPQGATTPPTATSPTFEPTSDGSSVAQSHGGTVTDYVSLVDSLRAVGAMTVPTGEVIQQFLDKQGYAIMVNGGVVQVFEYSDSTSANAVVVRIAPNGLSARTAKGGAIMVDWVGTPHLYKTARVIVIYVGNDSAVLTPLQKVLGSQFAGG